jgi:hypothetical protein
MYAQTGHVSVHLQRCAARGAAPDAAGMSSSYGGYFGTFRIDAARGMIIHRVEGGSIAEYIGGDEERPFRLVGDTLTLGDGRTWRRTLVRIQAPTPQNPSPMVEETRRHERLTERPIAGTARSYAGPAGRPVEIAIPKGTGENFDLVVSFHVATWLAHQSVEHANRRAVSVALNLGSGSGAYGRPFAEATAFDSLLAGISREVTSVVGRPAQPRRVTLVGFSAGYGALRAILREPRHFARVSDALLIDGIHASYIPEGLPIALGGTIDTTNLTTFHAFARAATRGEKRFLITHSEIFPGTFVSTTESTNWLLTQLGVKRTPVLEWGPRGLQQTSTARSGRFEIMGYAGNAGPDHGDQLHAMPELLRRLLR